MDLYYLLFFDMRSSDHDDEAFIYIYTYIYMGGRGARKREEKGGEKVIID